MSNLIPNVITVTQVTKVVVEQVVNSTTVVTTSVTTPTYFMY